MSATSRKAETVKNEDIYVFIAIYVFKTHVILSSSFEETCIAQVRSPTSKSQIQVPNSSPQSKSKVQRKGTGTGADTIILQATLSTPSLFCI